MSKVPCGGFELGDSLVINDGKLDLAPGAGGGLPTGGAPYQQLVTDGDGNAKWEDRLCYYSDEWADLTIDENSIDITWLVLPPVGETVTVKINGVESVETVKRGFIDTIEYFYIGTADYSTIASGGDGWAILYFPDGSQSAIGYAKPQTVVSIKHDLVKRIDSKYLPEPIVLTFVNDIEITSNMSREDMLNAVKNGAQVILKDRSSNHYLLPYDRGDNFIGVVPYAFKSDGSIGSLSFYKISREGNSDKFRRKTTKVTSLPNVITLDNDKFLRVINGSWTASDLIVPSSTVGSTKHFKINVDDSGAITATEVTT